MMSRPFLYIMVFCIFLATCDLHERLTRIERTVERQQAAPARLEQPTVEEKREIERRARHHGYIARDGRRIHYLSVHVDDRAPGAPLTFMRDGKVCRF